MPVSDRAIARYRTLLRRQSARTAALLAAAWDELEDYGDEERFIRMVTPLLNGAKASAVASSAAFFSLALDLRPLSVRAQDVTSEPRVRDPFLAMWHAVSKGRSNEDAIAVGRSAAEAAGEDYVTSTARRTGDVVAEKSGRAVRWARVPSGNSCAWCQTVAGQTYLTAESADFGHDRDHCVVVPA